MVVTLDDFGVPIVILRVAARVPSAAPITDGIAAGVAGKSMSLLRAKRVVHISLRDIVAPYIVIYPRQL